MTTALAGASADLAELKPVPEVLLSRQLMEQMHARAGDVITLAADAHGARPTQFRVVGAYEPTPDPKRFSVRRLEARLHLPDLLGLVSDASDPLSTESVNALNLALANP